MENLTESISSIELLRPNSMKILDLPIEIIEEVVEKLMPEERFVVRKVSRQFQRLIDSKDNGLQNIRFRCFSVGNDQHCTIDFNHTFVEYKNIFAKVATKEEQKELKKLDVKDDCYIALGYNPKSWTRLKGTTSFDVAMTDLAVFLKNPKTQLEVLSIHLSAPTDSHDYCSETITNLFSSQLSNLHVKTFVLKEFTSSQLAKILPCFKEGVLEEIHHQMFQSESNQFVFQELVELEQWKQAKCLTMKPAAHEIYDVDLSTDLMLIAHFPMLKVRVKTFTVEHAKQLKEIFSKIANFESWIIKGHITDPLKIVKVFLPDYSSYPEGSAKYIADGITYLIDFETKLFIFEKSYYDSS